MNIAMSLKNTAAESPPLSNWVNGGLFLQRKCACGSPTSSLADKCKECKSKKQLGLQKKLKISEPGDMYEQEADRVADRVMRSANSDISNRSRPQVHRLSMGEARRGDAPPIVNDVLSSPGQSLDPTARSFFEPRLGYDFSQVKVHDGPKAAESAMAVRASAYTVGRNVVFGPGQYAPNMETGRRLIAHELAHVVQQDALPSSAVSIQRQSFDGMGSEPDYNDIAAERQYGGSGAPKAMTCGRPSWCPAGFCSPYASEELAKYYRSKKAPWLTAGIAAAVNSRVVPLWREYLWGGSAPKNLTADFGKDFTNSPTTKKVTENLYKELKKSIAASPPSGTTVDIPTQIPAAIAEINDPASPKRMDFNIPKDIPGNLAGDIGRDQKACPAGAQPSPFNDERIASGSAEVVRSGSDFIVTPKINYLVKDTIDLCPGNCGSLLEQIATIPLSQFEATGISGDVPFTVDFPAPTLGSLTVLPAAPTPAPAPKKP